MTSTVTLALDAATYSGSVAVISSGRVLAERAAAMRGDTEERLLPAVAAALGEAGVRPAEVTRVACGAGPGSFTSLRIAASIAKAFAVARGAPLVAIPSLALLAVEARQVRPAPEIVVALDAMRGEWYTATARFGSSGALTELAELVLRPLAWVLDREAAGGAVAGPGRIIDLQPHARAAAPLLEDSARVSAWIVDAARWEPVYGRVAEAQARWARLHGRPAADADAPQ